ncbi:RNA ligase superfamily-domain-containing protein [Podospora conica]|nr:RNA ligase superfamily-domain-containing protein [Schizothecium conicum]
MATSTSPISLASHDTALCIVPPRERWSSVERLRALHDKAYEKWPPHVNLIYPFVQQDVLSSAATRIQDHLASLSTSSTDSRTVCLYKAGVFHHKHNNTLYLHDADTHRTSWLQELRKQVLTALGHPKQAHDGYQMHMTIAQSDDAASSSHRFLADKVALLPALEWDVSELAILVRERQQQNGTVTSHMKLWGVINLSDPARSSFPLLKPVIFYEPSPNVDGIETDEYPTRFYDDETDLWLPFDFPPSSTPRKEPRNLSISSYNILAEFHHPFTTSRNPLTISTLLSTPALSSILILQEVTDSSLTAILADVKIRAQYPFASHGPPVQPDVDPLPNHLNIVILSKYPFAWEHVSLRRKHKDAIIALFYLTDDPSHRGPEPDLVVAGVHLPHGVNDGAVVARRLDVQLLLRFLEKEFKDIPCVLAGDFNLATATATIDEAVEKGSLSSTGRAYINGFDDMVAEKGFVDAWEVMKDSLTVADEHEDDEGATFEPTRNEVAAAAVGSGTSMLSHRYDRILIRGEGRVELKGFNRFGFVKGMVGDVETFASDHWGVRCLMTIGGEISQEVSKMVVPIELVKAPQALSSAEGVIDALALPTPEEEATRHSAIRLVKNVILATPDDHISASSKPVVAVVPVGSFPLGVWTTSSDLDVMFIGPYSSQTFFALATQAIRKAATPDVKLIRRVKSNIGTMLELEVLGIKMDLQYCTATDIARNWPQVLTVPAANPIWSLPMQTLLKLKAARDLDYIRRSVPDLTTFRHAHRFIKSWAKAHGVYSARFGFLGGIQISILLARAQKLLTASNKTPPSLPDLITTFFTHYATFPFATHSVFDPFFHATSLPHHRSTTREPLAILGYFPPALNTTAAASVPSTRTLTHEFARTASALTTSTTWTDLISPTTAATSFLTSYKSYARLSVQYWGQSPTRGRQFIGWLESRCVTLLVDMHRRAPGIHARIWPARFVGPDSTEEDTTDYQGCYLIGLERANPTTTTKEDTQSALDGLRSALRRFEETMRADDKYFDARTCWLGAEVVSRGDLGALVLDGREWGEFAAGEDESETDEEEDVEDDADDDDAEGFGVDRLSIRNNKKAKKKAKDAVAPAPPGTGRKLRAATDVLNRLRWDPDLDSSDFVVGYEDRFLGAQEKALEAWRTEKTDEEFIPQHRILYFKRRSDGEVIWDRGARRDVLFGSGVDADA